MVSLPERPWANWMNLRRRVSLCKSVSVETFLDTVADTSNQPVYIHCGSANRVGAMWYIKRVKQDGWDSARAMTEAEAIGLRSEALKEFAVGYVTP